MGYNGHCTRLLDKSKTDTNFINYFLRQKQILMINVALILKPRQKMINLA